MVQMQPKETQAKLVFVRLQHGIMEEYALVLEKLILNFLKNFIDNFFKYFVFMSTNSL